MSNQILTLLGSRAETSQNLSIRALCIKGLASQTPKAYLGRPPFTLLFIIAFAIHVPELACRLILFVIIFSFTVASCPRNFSIWHLLRFWGCGGSNAIVDVASACSADKTTDKSRSSCISWNTTAISSSATYLASEQNAFAVLLAWFVTRSITVTATTRLLPVSILPSSVQKGRTS